MTKRKIEVSLLLALSLVALPPIWAGDLLPPGPPAPTMVTLEEIYTLLDSMGVGRNSVPGTGQTGCWDESGKPIACAGTGQDADHRAVVAPSRTFRDNGDGTARDNLTGLVWLKDANCFGPRNWTEALSDANSLADGACGLADGSVPGDWRLPNIRELHSLVDFGAKDPKLLPEHPFSGALSDSYWSSTTESALGSTAYHVHFGQGTIGMNSKRGAYFVWPVRRGE